MHRIQFACAGWLALALVASACGSDGGGAAADTTDAATDTLPSTEDTAVLTDSAEADSAAPTDTAVAADTVEPADTLATRAEWPPPEEIGPGGRPAPVIAPAGYDGYAALPAILLLGGYDYLSQDLDDWIALSGRVDSDGFVLVLPDGLIDADGSPYWNATDTCCDYYETGVDDVAWLTGLIDELRARFHVSGVGLVGHSAGGFMAYRMACEVPGRLSGLVSIAGSGYLDEAQCAVTDVPLSVLQVHGEVDDIMPFFGDDEAPGAYEMLERWGARDSCDPDSWVEEYGPINYATEGDTELGYFEDCPAGIDVRLWYLEGSDHYPDFKSRFTIDLLAWLLPHLR